MDKIEKLDRQWKSETDEFFDKLRIVLPKWQKRFKRYMNKIFNWYFFYNKRDKALHIFQWLCVTLVIFRVFGLI